MTALNSVFNLAPDCLTTGAVIARGANNTTLYEASMSQDGRSFQVAVKSFDTAGATAAFEAAFLREVQIARLASATCQHVCRLLGCCKLDGKVCLVMSLYTSSAASLLSNPQEPLDLMRVLQLAVEVAEGLGELHALNIWHLDLKPANILLDKYQHAYLADFGISHALQTLQSCTAQTGFAGTPHYMAPEQADADFGPRGSHTDVWGFATTILHLATGQLPYNGLSQFQIMTAMLKKRSPDVSQSLPVWLQQLIRQCLSFDVAQRPSVTQLLQELQQPLKQSQKVGNQMPSVPSVTLSHSAALFGPCEPPPPEQGARSTLSSMCTLVGLLRSAHLSIQTEAVQALAKIAAGPQESKDEVIAANALPALVSLLRSDDISVQTAAAKALGYLANGPEHMKIAILASGALPALVGLFRSANISVQAAAAQALATLADGPQHITAAIFAAGAVSALVGLLGSHNLSAQTAAAEALGKLAYGPQQIKDAIVAANALPTLISLSESGNFGSEAYAALALSGLAHGSQQNRDAIFAAGGLPVLLRMLKAGHVNVQSSAALALAGLAAGSQLNKDAIVAAQALPALVGSLTTGDRVVPHGVAAALFHLANGSQENQIAVLAADALPMLIGFLKSGDDHVQNTAACALGGLAAGSPRNKSVIFGSAAVPALTDLLMSHNSMVKASATRALATICGY